MSKPSDAVGLFLAAYTLKDGETLPSERQRELEERLDWFQHHVRPLGPDELDSLEQSAICWYKPTAVEAIEQTRALALFMEAQGFVIHVCQSRNPGIIIHADEVQIVAIPARNILHGLELRIRIWWRRHVPSFIS